MEQTTRTENGGAQTIPNLLGEPGEAEQRLPFDPPFGAKPKRTRRSKAEPASAAAVARPSTRKVRVTLEVQGRMLTELENLMETTLLTLEQAAVVAIGRGLRAT